MALALPLRFFIPPALPRALSSGHGFESLPRDDEHVAKGAIRVQKQLDDRGRDIACGRRRSHALNEISLGYTKIAGIACDGASSELGFRNDARRNRHESQAEPKTIRFLLTIVCHENLRAFGSGIPSC